MLSRLIEKVVLCLVLVGCGGVQAHTIRPAVVSISFHADATFTVAIRANLEAIMAQVGPGHADTDDSPNAEQYDHLRSLSTEDLTARFFRFQRVFADRLDARFENVRAPLVVKSVDVPAVGDVDLARKSVIHLNGVIPAGASRFTWHFPTVYGSNVLRLAIGEEVISSVWLKSGEVNDPFILSEKLVPPSRGEVALDYGLLGFTHILPLGLDHILFVLGIFLLSLRLRPILWQVTAFTLAHTITLGMTIYGLIALPASVVEPLIAISIIYVGVENILVSQLKPWRIVIVFLFGLLHGMGFAGVLAEIGLPRSEFLTALITFNVGVEFGQLAVITGALLIIGGLRHKVWYRKRVVIPLSALISLIGLYWTVERLV